MFGVMGLDDIPDETLLPLLRSIHASLKKLVELQDVNARLRNRDLRHLLPPIATGPGPTDEPVAAPWRRRTSHVRSPLDEGLCGTCGVRDLDADPTSVWCPSGAAERTLPAFDFVPCTADLPATVKEAANISHLGAATGTCIRCGIGAVASASSDPPGTIWFVDAQAEAERGGHTKPCTPTAPRGPATGIPIDTRFGKAPPGVTSGMGHIHTTPGSHVCSRCGGDLITLAKLSKSYWYDSEEHARADPYRPNLCPPRAVR